MGPSCKEALDESGRLGGEFVPLSDQVRLKFDEAYAKPLKTYGKGRK